MKGLILSGGHGTRLRPITYTSAKQLIPICNKPILFYGLEELKKAGINNVNIIVGDTKNEIKETVNKEKNWGLKINYIHQKKPLGLAHAVKISRKNLKNSSFLMYLGDNILKYPLKKLIDKFNKEKLDSLILLAKVRDPQRFGVAIVEKDKVIKLVEKPKEYVSDLAVVGVYIFNSSIFEAIDRIKPSKRGELEITDAIQELIDMGKKVSYLKVSGWWKDTGKIEDLLEANRFILNDIKEKREDNIIEENSQIGDRVIINKNSKVINSVIRGPSIIGEGCIIENSYIGPFTSIDKQAKIINSEIEHSIILEGANILNVQSRIIDSLIGKNAKVEKKELVPKANRFMIGDSSVVSIL